MTKPGSNDESPERETPVDREGEPPLADAREAARLCSISESMLYKLNAAGRMPPAIRLGTLLRWRRREILEWIDAGCPAEGWEEGGKEEDAR